MINSKKIFSKSVITYGIGTFFQRIGSFILVPLYTSALTINEYGAYETITVIVHTLQIILNFGLSSALIRFYSSAKDEEEKSLMIRSSIFTIIGLSLLISALMIPAFKPLSKILLKDESYTLSIVLAFAWSIGAALNQQYFSYFRVAQKSLKYSIISILYFLISAFLNIIFVRYLNLNLNGIFLGNLISVWSLNVFYIYKFFNSNLTVSFKWMKTLLSFGFPLVFSNFGWLIINSSDRYFLAYFHDLAEVGTYALGFKIGLIAQIAIVTPFQLAWGPYMFSMCESLKEDAKTSFSQIFTYLLTGFSFVGMGVYLFSGILVEIFGSGKYPEAVKVVSYVLFAYLFNGIYYWAANFLHLKNKTTLISLIVFGMAALNLLLNWLLIPTQGWRGAAWATLISVCGTGILTLLAAQNAYPVKLEYRRIIKLGLVIVIILLIYSFINVQSHLLTFILSSLLLFCMPILLWFLGFFYPFEKLFIINYCKNIKERKFWHIVK